MRIVVWSAFMVLALVIGCVSDGLDLEGDLPGFAAPTRGNTDCELGVDAESPAGAEDPRLPASGLIAADGDARLGGSRSVDSVDFHTSSCELQVSE